MKGGKNGHSNIKPWIGFSLSISRSWLVTTSSLEDQQKAIFYDHHDDSRSIKRTVHAGNFLFREGGAYVSHNSNFILC